MRENDIQLSIIICTYNAEKTIEKTLECVFSSPISGSEVVIVDDASTDGTLEVCSRFNVQPIEIKRNCGPAVCRNIGVANSQGTILLFLDSDATFHPSLPNKMLYYLRSDCGLAGVGTISAPRPLNPCFFADYFALQEYLLVTDLLQGNSSARLPYICTRCGCIRREVFNDLGGFSVEYKKPSIEDYEFSTRMVGKYHVLYDKTLQNEHHFPDTLTKIFRRYLRNTAEMTKLVAGRKSIRLNPFKRELPARICTGCAGFSLLCAVILDLKWLIPSLAMTAVAMSLQKRLLNELFKLGGLKFMLKGWLLYCVCSVPIFCGALGGLLSTYSSKLSQRIKESFRAEL